jgi:hypothetical protein
VRYLRALPALAALLAAWVPVDAAMAQAAAEERITGVFPDAALSVGAGIGLGNGLSDNVFARLRLGGLLAYEPWVVNLGITGEVGGLAELGLGGELEVNHFGGLWLQLNGSRVDGAQYMGHLALGFTLFGVEWQHRFGGSDDNALLFLLRLPIGIWWFMWQHQADATARSSSSEAGHQREP